MNPKLLAAIAALIAATVALIFVLTPFQEEQPKKMEAEEKTEAGVVETQPSVNLAPWQRNEWSGPTDDSLTPMAKAWTEKQLDGSQFEKATSKGLPSEDAGFTSDPTESNTEDGTINPLYSYWTDASVEAESRLSVEALVNPLYGGWNEAQATGDNKLIREKLSPLFTQAFNNSGQNYPVLVGANGAVESGGALWIGVVTDSKATMKWDDKTMGYMVNATYTIDYSAFDQNGNRISMKGTMKLSFVPAPPAEAETDGFRVKINTAILRITK